MASDELPLQCRSPRRARRACGSENLIHSPSTSQAFTFWNWFHISRSDRTLSRRRGTSHLSCGVASAHETHRHRRRLPRRDRPLRRRPVAPRWRLGGRGAVAPIRSRAPRLPPPKGRPARQGRVQCRARVARYDDACLLCGVPGGQRCRGRLRVEHRSEPGHASQCGQRARWSLAPPGARRPRHWHQILWHAPGAAEDAHARVRPASSSAQLLLRPDRLARRLSARTPLDLDRTSPTDRLRLRAWNGDVHLASHRGLCRRFPGARAAAALPRQGRGMAVDLPGHRVEPDSRRSRVGRGSSRAVPTKRSTSPMATASGGAICGHGSQRSSKCRWANRSRSR